MLSICISSRYPLSSFFCCKIDSASTEVSSSMSRAFNIRILVCSISSVLFQSSYRNSRVLSRFSALFSRNLALILEEIDSDSVLNKLKAISITFRFVSKFTSGSFSLSALPCNIGNKYFRPPLSRKYLHPLELCAIPNARVLSDGRE